MQINSAKTMRSSSSLFLLSLSPLFLLLFLKGGEAKSLRGNDLPVVNFNVSSYGDMGYSFAQSARTAVNLLINNFNGYPMIPNPTDEDEEDPNNRGISASVGNDLITSIMGQIGTVAQELGGDYQLGSSVAEEYGAEMCSIGPQAVKQLIYAIQFNQQYVGKGPYDAGIGAGWGFQIYCNDQQLLSWGMGLGGGISSDASGTQFSGGFGGGGGAQASGFAAGGGGGYNLAMGAAGGTCGIATDPGSSPSFTLPQNIVTEIESCISSGELTLCGGGGGGGGFDSASGHYGGGFGFSLSGTIGTFSHPSRSANCPASTGGGEVEEVEGLGGSDSVGGAARACQAQCNQQSQGSDFYKCYCPCFKQQATALGMSWAPQISCTNA